MKERGRENICFPVKESNESASAENASLTTGIRPAPGVEGTESVLDGQLFGLDFQEDPDAATSIPGAGTGGGEPGDLYLKVLFSKPLLHRIKDMLGM